MYKKTITYTDFDGNERVEDFYFNMTKAELIDFGLAPEGGLDKVINKIIQGQNNKQMIEIFKDLLQRAYGEKSLDGRKFMKSPEITKNFTETQAYSDMFIELASDSKAAADFINGITPKDMDLSEESLNKTLNNNPTLKGSVEAMNKNAENSNS